VSGRTFNLYFDKNRETLEEIYNKSGLRGVANFVGCCKTTAFNQFNRLGVKIKSSKFKKGCVSFMKGKHFSEKSIEKMSLSQKKRFQRENVWNKGKEMGEKFSKKCSIAQKKRFETEDSWNKGNHGFMAGEKHYNWQGGKSFEPYGPEFNNKLREQIRNRDSYRCQQCFRHQDELYTKTGRKYKLTVHHIDYNKKNNDKGNLISLCRGCHAQTNFGREDWTNYFNNKL